MSEVVVITGGSRGIGRATALKMAENGADIAFSYVRDEDSAANAREQLMNLGVRVIAVKSDAAEERDVRRLFEKAQLELGPITSVVNNAGIVAPSLSLVDIDVARLRRMFDVNVLGAYLVAREGARVMSTSRGGAGGAIVNISSIAARLGSPDEYVDYAGSKAAVDTLTVGLAKELALEGVRVNAVRPGLMDTDIHASGGQPDRAHRLGKGTPLGRPGTAEEAANAIVWLLSDEASYVTGALLDVSGGR